MANNEAGAFLNITPDVLKKLDSFDEKLEKIEKHAHTAADALKNGFGNVVIDTTKLENAITSLANKMNALNSAGNAIGNIGTSAQGSARNVSSMNESLSRAAELMNRIGSNKIGEGPFSTWNIKGLNQYYSDLKKYVENTDLSKPQQEAAIRAMQYMKMELAEQRKTDEQRAQSAEKAAQRKEAADRKAAKAAADLANAQRSTPQGALDYSKNTKSLKENVQAIEYLKKARLSLNTTDKNYQATLQQINQAIARHNQALQQAGAQSQNLATRHRNLMDTAGQLQRKLALVFSVSQIEGYVKKLANVRGEFELQQRSLQAILQNKSQADEIFNKTVQLAVKSPYKIKELISFTKQLAAYRIESNKLYDTTKRLADVSAGLGVDMGRLILAYGQVKAAAYLRGTEVRQFTEAGINLYGELQRYFEEVKGEAYTTAQIVDMISKRKVTFEDIENIFQRLTDKGGLFYNMQEIQAETLRGKISNLQDSIDVMLNSIGKANEDTLKGAIDTTKLLLDNWETVVEVAKTFGVVIGSLAMAQKFKLASKEAKVLTSILDKGVDSAFAFGKALKASLPLMALGLAIQYVTNLTNRMNEYNKTISSIGNRKYEARLKIAEFDNEAKTDARKALNALVKEMNNAGFSIKIKTDLSEEEARKQFDEYKKQYEAFIEDIAAIEAKHAALKKGEGLREYTIGGNIDESLSSYSEKAGELMIVGNQARKELLRIATESKTLTEQQRKELEELAINAKDSAEGYAEVANKLREVTKVDIHTFTTSFGAAMSNVATSFGGLQSKVLEGFLNTSKGFDVAAENAKKKIIALFGDVNKEMSSDEKNSLKLLIDTHFLNKQINEVTRNFAYKIYDIPKVSTIEEKSGNEEINEDQKLQRDILAERISLIKELNKEYEKLNKVMGSKEAAKTVMERYASQLKDVKMPENIIGEAFLPNKENTAKALQEFSKTISDFRKRIGAQKDTNVLFDEKDAEDIKNQLEKTKKNIEDMFNGLDLHKKLKDAGFSEAEVQQLFPGLAKTLDDVEKGMKASYKKNFPKGEYLVEGTDANKQYLSDLDKLNQQRVKESQDLVVELTKAYKTQLSDQLQLDRWYYEERAKIQKANLTKEQKAQYEANLQKQYGKKSDENAWKQFQESDFYIDLFQNLDNVSTKTLIAMREKLADMKEQLKDLQPSQVRAIANNMEKLNEVLAGRNPFKELIPNLKSYIGSLKDRNKYEDDYIKALKEQEKVEKRLYGYTKTNEDGSKERVIGESEVLAQLEAEYNAIAESNNATEEQKNAALEKLNYAKEVVRKTEEELANNKKITDEKKAQVDADRRKLDAANKSLNEVAKYGAEAVDAVSEFTGMLESFGVEMPEWLKNTTEGLGQIFDGLSSIDLTRPFSVVTGAFKTIAGIGKTIGSLFGIGNKDKKKEREIKRQIENVEKLQKAYEVLKEKMDEAWNSVTLHDTTKQTIANVNQQIRSYQQMIKAEHDKKKTDQKRIDEWNDAIKELEKTKQEILKQEQMDLGGIGGNSEYKSAAESFVQSWMDAFNETGKGIEGLEDSFDSMIENLIVKQATMRLAQGRLKKLFEEIDKSVTEGSAGGINLTKDELANINAIADTALSGLNEDLLALMETLGYKGKGKTAELSALTQAVQSVTETTAEELAALLNSVRFFVSQQTTDISAIRALLDARYGLEAEYSDSNPMLVELRAQTGYLEILSDRIDRVFTTNVNSRGAAIRVVMQ